MQNNSQRMVFTLIEAIQESVTNCLSAATTPKKNHIWLKINFIISHK